MKPAAFKCRDHMAISESRGLVVWPTVRLIKYPSSLSLGTGIKLYGSAKLFVPLDAGCSRSLTIQAYFCSIFWKVERTVWQSFSRYPADVGIVSRIVFRRDTIKNNVCLLWAR